MIPRKWALGILVAIIVYALAQPWLNRTFGWHLPSLTTTARQESEPSVSTSEKNYEATPKSYPKPVPEPKSEPSDVASKSASTASTKSDSKTNVDAKISTNARLEESSSQNTTVKDAASKPTTNTKVDSKPSTGRSDTTDLAAKLGVTGESDLSFGYLKEIGRERYQSPQGLIYTRGSDEGHRLKHIQRHLKDQSDRPGSHGVFDGDMPQVLRWIDETYRRASQGDRMAKKRQEDESTIYELTFDKPIGYIGGIEGKRRKNPPTKRLRLVVIDRNVITAFPF
jgi:hypothetical protein